MTPGDAGLLEVLERSRELGFLGPGPVLAHIEHARALARASAPAPTEFLDLGSGGGVPGLILAREWPDAAGTLLDANERRCQWLEDAVRTLGLDRRLVVACGRAEALARDPALRARFELVVARSFAAPAVTAECAIGFLTLGGRLVVSEPPAGSGPSRWPSEGLAELGFAPAQFVAAEGASVVVMVQERAEDRWPRRTGIPAKRPLWRSP